MKDDTRQVLILIMEVKERMKRINNYKDLAAIKRALSDGLIMAIDKKAMARDRDLHTEVAAKKV